MFPVRRDGGRVLRSEGDVREVLVQTQCPTFRPGDASPSAEAVRGT